MANVFSTTAEGTTTQQQQTEQAGIIDALVGEGKKYKTVEDLAKGYNNADNFINQLKTEQDQLRSELDKRLTAEEMVEQIKREREEQQRASQSTQENTTSQLDPEALSKLISNTIDQRDTAKTAQANIAAVDAKIKSIYGDKAAEVFQKKAAELGLSLDWLQDVAGKSPDAVYNLFGINSGTRTTTPSVTASTTNTVAVDLANSANAMKDDSWDSFEQLRKTNPKLYFKAETQQKLFKARRDKGQAFYS
jgi:hypothetical protein